MGATHQLSGDRGAPLPPGQGGSRHGGGAELSQHCPPHTHTHSGLVTATLDSIPANDRCGGTFVPRRNDDKKYP